MNKSNIKQNILYAIYAIVGVGIVALLASLLTNSNSIWYTSLTKPSEIIPDFIFPIVWSTIYTMSAIVIFLLLKNNQLTNKVLINFCINGVLNVLWCLAFFTLNQLLIGLIIIIFNLTFAILLVRELFKNRRLYGYLLMIYPLWMMLATASNLALWILN